MPDQGTETSGQSPLILRLLRNRGFRFVAAYLIISFMLITRYGVSEVLQAFFNFPSFLLAVIPYALITGIWLPCIEKKPQRAGAILIFFSLFFLVLFCSLSIADGLASQTWPSLNYPATLRALVRAIFFALVVLVGNRLYKKFFGERMEEAWKKPKG